LPNSVPIHLNWRGEADSFGPKFMVWLIPAIQLSIAALMLFSGYAIATHAPGTHGSLPGMTVIAVCMAALTWRVQMLIIEAARNAGKCVSMRGFWAFFAVWLCVVLFDAFVIG
jgi:hypothetical protein